MLLITKTAAMITLVDQHPFKCKQNSNAKNKLATLELVVVEHMSIKTERYP